MRILFVVYDNGSYDHHFPMGLGAIGAVLKKEGHEIEIWNQDMHHWPNDYLRVFLDNNKSVKFKSLTDPDGTDILSSSSTPNLYLDASGSSGTKDEDLSRISAVLLVPVLSLAHSTARLRGDLTMEVIEETETPVIAPITLKLRKTSFRIRHEFSDTVSGGHVSSHSRP